MVITEISQWYFGFWNTSLLETYCIPLNIFCNLSVPYVVLHNSQMNSVSSVFGILGGIRSSYDSKPTFKIVETISL